MISVSLVFPRGIPNIWRKEMVCRLQISVKFPAVRVWVRASGLLGFQLTLMREVRNEVSKALHSGCRRLLTAFDEVSSNFELKILLQNLNQEVFEQYANSLAVLFSGLAINKGTPSLLSISKATPVPYGFTKCGFSDRSETYQFALLPV